jgi:hypothetical protein
MAAPNVKNKAINITKICPILSSINIHLFLVYFNVSLRKDASMRLAAIFNASAKGYTDEEDMIK